LFKRIILQLITVLLLSSAALAEKADHFELLMNGHGDLGSYIYFKQDGVYFIDTELKGSMETFRYRKFFFLLNLEEEVYMGRKYHSNMVFDPNRGSWAFGLTGRMEFEKYFFETQLYHNCFHDIGRWMAIDYSIYWNSPRIGFGTKGYLSKYKYHRYESGIQGWHFPDKLDYFIQAAFYTPRGASWQKNHEYDFSMQTNINWAIARYKAIGFEIESNNLWVINSSHDLKRRHSLDFDWVFFGKNGVMIAYLGWWPDDTQAIRNRDGKTVFGLHFGF
jgi:hypothetical protein